jgi:hypothetical protein
MLRLSHITATGLLLIGLSANLAAEEINLPSSDKTQTTEFSVQVPGRGMSMETVQNRFGEALTKEAAVGSPPISKWIYNNFTVYFESEYVIHAVVNN